eukprot:TRINITY_DN1907_c0_g1_i1.p1 TRINITY_DN1907_c0_g1~~TRINITY_DN1907_c0_g1_i1.p1  ORF type:complete len:488 (-),score=83.61 TRINITY_DN1907_c0_g1_i1:255-1649(-)
MFGGSAGWGGGGGAWGGTSSLSPTPPFGGGLSPSGFGGFSGTGSAPSASWNAPRTGGTPFGAPSPASAPTPQLAARPSQPSGYSFAPLGSYGGTRSAAPVLGHPAASNVTAPPPTVPGAPPTAPTTPAGFPPAGAAASPQSAAALAPANRAPPNEVPATNTQEPAEPGHEHYFRGPERWCGHEYEILGYWKIRGLAAPIRMLYHYQGVRYVDKFYELQAADGSSESDADKDAESAAASAGKKKGKGGAAKAEGKEGAAKAAVADKKTPTVSRWDRSEWTSHRDTTLRANNPLVNLPYLESVDRDGGLLLSQSNAILNYLARRFGLMGCGEIDAAKADMLLDQCADMRAAFSALCYRSDDFEATKAAYLADDGPFETNFRKMDEWLAEQGAEFLVEDDHPIHADFVFWELCDVHEMMSPGCLDAYPRVQRFHRMIRDLPKLQHYFSSPLYQLPPNNKVAKWGSGM